ncbi:hypothetical protein NQ317_001828 [Molorchus minor]|uniref:C2H2-type domain-containing protein n=1 Tax=Molorchus minor TaxID=1323400 RepID=A0ABQ9JBA7_9CUCU|nr:hypothetical protein NQ317_001828 [Molorchus minor]
MLSLFADTGPLARYLQFATVCATTEEKITKYREQIESNGQDLVELNRARKFCYDNEILRKRTLSGNIESNCRPIENIEVFGVKSVPCVQQKTGCLGNDANHLLIHKKDPSPLVYGENSSEIKRGRSHFKTKRLFHKKTAKVEMYECEKCQFKTKRKEYLYKHHLVHRENSEVEMYKCGTCEFKTKRKHSLKVHRLVHRANSEVDTYECDACGFKTKYRWYLKNHLWFIEIILKWRCMNVKRVVLRQNIKSVLKIMV